MLELVKRKKKKKNSLAATICIVTRAAHAHNWDQFLTTGQTLMVAMCFVKPIKHNNNICQSPKILNPQV